MNERPIAVGCNKEQTYPSIVVDLGWQLREMRPNGENVEVIVNERDRVEPDPAVRRYRQTVLSLLAAGFCLFMCIGCLNPNSLVKPKDGNTPSINQTVDAGALFQSLADAIDGKTLHDSATMARIVSIHKRNGWIDGDAEAKFDSAFPDAANQSKQRDLTADDAKTLRGIK